MKKNYFWLGISFAFINSLCIGTLGLIDKIGSVNSSNPFIFSTQSVVFSLLFSTLFALLYFRKDLIKNVKNISFSSWKLIFFVGVFASGFFILFRFLGLTQSTGTFASLSQVVTTTGTFLLALLFLRENISKIFWLLFVIISVAIYFVSIGKFTVTTLHSGDGYIIVSALFLAAGNIFSQLAVKQIQPVILSVGRFFCASLFLLLITLFLFQNNTDLFHFNVWALISGLLWAFTVIIFNFALQKIGVTFTLSIIMTAPVYTMLLEYFILNQTFNVIQITAAVIIILSGIAIVVLKKRGQNYS